MLPNFLAIGAQKAGSSWLGVMLNQHPDVFVYPKGEIHFFNARFDRGLSWYESHFDEWDGQSAVGEKSPMYLSHPLAPERIRATLGDGVRLIASFRHPVERAHSQYWHSMRHGRIAGTTDFVEAFHRREQLRREGLYGEHLSRLLQHVPRSRVLILIFEEMMGDRRRALADCYRFLGVREDFEPSDPERRVNQARDVAWLSPQLHAVRKHLKRIPSSVAKPLIDAGRRAFELLPRRRRYEPLPEEVRDELMGHFAEDVDMLEDALGRDLTIWREPGRRSRRADPSRGREE